MRLFLVSLAAIRLVAALDQNNYDACYDPGSACDMYINQPLCEIDKTNNTKYWSCYCNDYIPVQQLCEECKYEYNIASTYDFSYETSACSKHNQTIGTVAETVLESITNHMATITIAQSRTFDPATVVAASTTSISDPFGAYSTYTSTQGGSSIAVSPIATAPPSVQDMGSNPTTPNAGNGLGAVRSLGAAGARLVAGVAGLLLL